MAIVTGTRAEFGLLTPVLKTLQNSRIIEPKLIVTGMHLLPKFGRTIDEIRALGFHVDATVRMQTGRDDATQEAAAVGKGVHGIANALKRLDCEGVLVLGDRIEAFAGATAASLSRRVLFHIHGGDRALGDLDDTLRDAISRLADVHFAATRDAGERLRRMGEPDNRIHVVGAPGLDDIVAMRVARRHAPITQPSNDRPYALCIQHPIGRSAATEARVCKRIIQAIRRCDLDCVAVYPNSDPGHSGIVDVLKTHKGKPGFTVFKTLPRADFIQLAAGAVVMVGNSSSGVIESASLGIPAVNVGPRQAGRLRCGPNVIDVSDTGNAIEAAIRRAIRAKAPRRGRSVYGDGRTGPRIAKLMERLIMNPPRRPKRLAY